MQFSDTTTRQGLIQSCEDYCGFAPAGISGDSTKLQTFTRLINEGYKKVASIIFKCDGRWQWDDTNQTDDSTSDGNLSTGVSKYDILLASPAVNQDWLEVERVEILDSDDNSKKLRPINRTDIGCSLDEFMDVASTPEYFDWTGSQIRFFPAPDYDKTDGFTIYFKRAPLLFATTDTTKRPGINSLYHNYLALYASMMYCKHNDMNNRVAQLEKDLALMEVDIKEHYGKRDKYEKKQIKRLRKSYR